MDYYLGQIALFATNFTPRGWVLCDGRLLDINSNQSLFALIGARFGGDGITKFAVPDLRTAMFGTSPNFKIRYYISTIGIWPDRAD